MTFMTRSKLKGKRKRGQKSSNGEERNQCGREEGEEMGSVRQP